MKSKLVTLILVALCVSSAFAQGDFVDKGQSGLFAQNTYFWGKDISGGRVQLGYHALGWADVGLSLSNNAYGWLYEHPARKPLFIRWWTPSVYAREYFWRQRDKKGGFDVILSLYQAYSRDSKRFLMSSGARPYLSLGGTGTVRLPLSKHWRLLFTTGYMRNITLKKGNHDWGVFQPSITAAAYIGDLCLSLSGRMFNEEGLTTYGVSLGLMRITGSPVETPLQTK